MAEEKTLVGGPQDGGKVRRDGEGSKLPDSVYVGPKPLGDGYSAWSDKKSTRFPACYVRHGRVFRFSNR